MIINQNDIVKTIPVAAAGTEKDTFQTINEVIKNVKELAETWVKIRDGGNAAPVVNMETMDNTQRNFKAAPEQNFKGGETVIVNNCDNCVMGKLFKTILKATKTYEAIGNGNAKIGDVIASAPFTVKQVNQMLEQFIAANFKV